MRALSIEVAAVIVDAAVVQGAEAHEAVLQRVVPLLVHVVVPDYILFTGKPLQRQGQRGGYIIPSDSATSHFIFVEAAAATRTSQLGGGESCAHTGEDFFFFKMMVIDLLDKSQMSIFSTQAYQAF